MGDGRRHYGRRQAREVLLQVLCGADVSSHSLDNTISWVSEQAGLSQENRTFIQQMASQVISHRMELDDEIWRHAPAWPVAQLPVVDRNILRLAIYEIKLAKDAPPRVAVNEAVELAKQFGSDGSQRFVNGVLGAVMKELETQLLEK